MPMGVCTMTAMPNPPYRRSRCTISQPVDMTWLEYVDTTHNSVVALADWIDTLQPFAQEFVVGQMDALQESAAAGLLRDGDDGKIKPIRVDPDIYELRWKLLSKAVRQYHAEPPAMPAELVRLHVHIKTFVPKNRPLTSRLQDAEIKHAQGRYGAGESSSWGSRITLAQLVGCGARISPWPD